MELPQQFVDHEKIKEKEKKLPLCLKPKNICVFFPSKSQSVMNILFLSLSHCNCVVVFVVCLTVQVLIM